MSGKVDLFQEKLNEMFQIKTDLDFGIYKIMNANKLEVMNYINNTLPLKISEYIDNLKIVNLENDEKIKSLQKSNETLLGLTSSPEIEEKINLNKQEIERLSKLSQKSYIEEDIYDHLFNFFSRYYTEGDFISQRRYKDNLYSIPYAGEEVKLHWANHDQYYVKSSENFKNYNFMIDNLTVSFILLDAVTERDNNKESGNRTFKLIEKIENDNNTHEPIEIIEDNEKIALNIYFNYVYLENQSKQKEYNNITVEKVKEFIINKKNDYSHTQQELLEKLIKDKKTEKYTYIEYHLNTYTAKNTFDYFIHKNLENFLLGELDLYIKNEVIFKEDLFSIGSDNNLKLYIQKAEVIYKIGKDIITFLSQIEEIQKELYLKKKFVTETNYCITLDKIDECFFDEIKENTKQIKEWVKLFSIDNVCGGGILKTRKVAI